MGRKKQNKSIFITKIHKISAQRKTTPFLDPEGGKVESRKEKEKKCKTKKTERASTDDAYWTSLKGAEFGSPAPSNGAGHSVVLSS